MGYEYNGITIANCLTTQFETEMEKDPSGADALWSKYTIRVRGFLTRVSGDPQSPTISLVNDTSSMLKLVKDKLAVPRRGMSYSVGGTTLVEIKADVFGLAMDAKYGPEPLPTKVYQVTSGCYMVETGCIVRTTNCGKCHEFEEENDPVVSLRWSQNESFSENWTSTYTTSGLLIVRTDFFQSADSFRRLCVPDLPKDYIRISSAYTLSADGTRLEFKHVDEERDRLPPAPATKASGTFSIKVESGSKRTGTVSVHLEGPAGTSRKLLMIRALEICYSKIDPEFISPDPNVQNTTAVYFGTFSENLFEPAVDVTMSALLSNVIPTGRYSNGDGTSTQVKSPVMFTSVGQVPAGCAQGRNGIKPNDRKRIKSLLAQAFADPCCGE